MQCKTEMNITIDARELRCPMPLLKLKQALAASLPGATVEIIATDRGALRDIPAYLALTQHRLIEQVEQATEFRFKVQKEA